MILRLKMRIHREIKLTRYGSGMDLFLAFNSRRQYSLLRDWRLRSTLSGSIILVMKNIFLQSEEEEEVKRCDRVMESNKITDCIFYYCFRV